MSDEAKSKSREIFIAAVDELAAFQLMVGEKQKKELQRTQRTLEQLVTLL